MDKASPIYSFGTVRHGTVNWKIKYFYKVKRTKGKYSISDVKTEVDILYYVPKLAKNKNLQEGTREVFQRYYQILKEYLTQHSKTAIMAANEIENELIKIKDVKNDYNIIKKITKLKASEIINKYKNISKDYEINTYEGFLESVRKEKLL